MFTTHDANPSFQLFGLLLAPLSGGSQFVSTKFPITMTVEAIRAWWAFCFSASLFSFLLTHTHSLSDSIILSTHIGSPSECLTLVETLFDARQAMVAAWQADSADTDQVMDGLLLYGIFKGLACLSATPEIVSGPQFPLLCRRASALLPDLLDDSSWGVLQKVYLGLAELTHMRVGYVSASLSLSLCACGSFLYSVCIF